jgi:ribosomal protein S18 acetylase RimI-like enzyme
MTEGAGVTVRRAAPADAGDLQPMVAALMAAEGKATPAPARAPLARWLDPADPAFEALIASLPAGPAGYLAFYRAFSLFKPGPVLLVENVWVDPGARRAGVGRALLATAAAIARARGWTRLELNVAESNRTAVAAYARLGFAAPGEAVRRLDDGGLARLAGQAPGQVG